jgi:hypothetical protein
MCRSTLNGGRRCPSHTDPVLISNRNARRRAKYAKEHGLAKEQAENPGVTVSHSVAPISFDHSLFNYKDITVKTELYRKSKKEDEEVNAFGVSSQEYEGFLVDKGYIADKQYSGQLNYTKLDENSYKELGFQAPEEIRVSYLKDEQLSDISLAELKNLTMGEKKALNTFTSNDFRWINGALFGKATLAPETEEEAANYKPQYEDDVATFEISQEHETEYGENTPSRLKEIVESLDRAVDKGPKQQRILYRGMSSFHKAWGSGKLDKYIDDNYSIGQEVKFDGYQSASYSPLTALSRARGGIVFEIRTPSGVNVTGISNYEDEQEAILSRDSRYMIVGIHKKAGFTANNQGYAGTSFDITRDDENVTIIQMIEITENGYIKDESNFASAAPLKDSQLQTQEEQTY